MSTPINIVVGIDGRTGGWEGLALARRLARLEGGRITAVCAYPTFGFEHARLVWGHVHDESDSRRVLDEARRRLAGDDGVELVAVAGAMPAVCLADVARERDADLLVLGGSLQGPLGRALGASVLSAALVDPPCPVVVAPRGRATGITRMHRVGVAVDGSPEAFAAVRWAHTFADAHEEIRELQLIAVDPQARTSTKSLAHGELLTTASARRARGQAQPDVRWTQRCGDTADELVALSLHLDLLVIGTHGRGGLSRLLHGSVSRDVARHVRCPLVVVPSAP